MPPTSQTKRIDSLYTLKAVCSFFVVTIHTTFFLKGWFLFIVGVAVPCFLAITGYFLYSDSREQELKKCKKGAAKAFKTSLLFFAFYWCIYSALGRHYTCTDLLINLVTGLKICSPMWYLAALWEALLLFWLIRKYAPRLIYYLPILVCLTYTLSTHGASLFCHMNTGTLDALRLNAIVTALPCLCIGYLIHKHKDWIFERINIIVCLSLSLLALIAEEYVSAKYHLPSSYIYLFTYPSVVMILLFCVKFPHLKIPVLNYIGIHHSANIYYFHMAVFVGLEQIGVLPSRWETVLVWLACIPVSMLFNTSTKLLSSLFKRFKSPTDCQNIKNNA